MPQIERVGDRIWLRAGDGFIPKQAFDRFNHRAQSVIGASWRKKDRVWTYPLDMIICRDLRAAFGDELEIRPKLREWAREQVEVEKRITPLLTARDSDNLTLLPRRAPRIWEAMNDGQHEYQKPVVEYCVVKRRAQNASQPGLGKTIETLGALIEGDVRGLVLVAAPKTSLRTVWEPEVQRWLPGVPVFACTGSKSRRQSTLDQAMRTWQSGKHTLVLIVINPEMLRTHSLEECLVPGCGYRVEDHKTRVDGVPIEEKYPQHDTSHKTAKWFDHEYPALFETAWSAIVVDETHRYILNVNLRTNKATLVGTGAMLLPVADDAMKLALSGTPWKGKPKNAWSIGHWLFGDVGLTASFWNWANRVLQVEVEQHGHKASQTHKKIGGIGDEETFNRWCDSFMIRHTKAEMAPWLPPKSYAGSPLDASDPDSPIGIWLDMEGPQDTAYRAMEKDAAVKLDNGTLIGNGILAELTRLKQFAIMHGDLKDKVVKSRQDGQPVVVKQFVPKLPSNKFEWTLEFLEEHGITGNEDEEGDSKVVFASQFTEVIKVMAAEYERRGIKCFSLTGEQSDKQREDYVKRFQQPGGPRVFLLNTMAGGVAVTLDAADDLVFMDETYVPDDQEQVEDRTHRTSKVHNVTIYYLRSRDSIDEKIARLTKDKDDLQKRLLDGKRGVEFARKLLSGGDKT